MSTSMTARRAAGRGRGLGQSAKVVAGLAISALFLYATLSSVSMDRLVAALAGAKTEWLALGLMFIGLDYAVKVYRWQIMLKSLGGQVRAVDAAVPFMGCVALNNVLPFRAGDVIRVVAFQKITHLPTSAQLGTLVIERLLDLCVLLGLLLAAVSIWTIDVLPEPMIHGLRLAAAAVVITLVILFAAPGPISLVSRWAKSRWPLAGPVTDALLRLSQAISTLSSPLLLARLAMLSVLAWLLEGGAFFAVGHALGLGLPPQAALLALAVGTLSTIIPSSPGYVGTFHYFTAVTIAAFGIGEVESTAYAVVVHGLLWGSTTACGFFFLSTAGLGSALRSASTQRPNP